VLGWIGGKSIETPYYEIGQVATSFYFFYFFVLIFFDQLAVREIPIVQRIAILRSIVPQAAINVSFDHNTINYLYAFNLMVNNTPTALTEFYGRVNFNYMFSLLK
jgi:hypothetical protein